MFTANIYTPLDMGMVLIQLRRWKFSHRLFQERMQSSRIFEESEVRGQGQVLGGGGLAQLVATLVGSTKLLYAGPG